MAPVRAFSSTTAAPNRRDFVSFREANRTISAACRAETTAEWRLDGARAGREPIQFYTCFITYAKRIHDQIDDAIRVHDRLLLLLSSESMASPRVTR